ncbi:hypothetical protein RAA17_18420 [Komagataeibacter rhaeticus]|nr:hypothetical protein [Komagataeibacter rhaeticus]
MTRFFDLVLLPGTKTRDRMLAGGWSARGTHAVIGYPKFDIIDMGARPRF